MNKLGLLIFYTGLLILVITAVYLMFLLHWTLGMCFIGLILMGLGGIIIND